MKDNLYTIFQQSSGVSTDTRTLRPGELFFALRGPNFDGNQYAAQALEKGAAAVVVDADLPSADARYLRVENTLAALQQLAAHHRRQWGGPVLGITGSNGKTTTRALVASVLAQEFNVYATPGNRNNHIGVPLSVLELTPAHTFAVLELGDNQPGDIAELCAIAQPDYGLITNVGLDHLAGYPDQAANVATKLELFTYVVENGKAIFVNADDEAIAPYVSNDTVEALSFGQENPRALVLGQLEMNRLDGLQFKVTGGRSFTAPLYGAYNLPNLLAAVCVGRYFVVDDDAIQAGLNAFTPIDNRSAVVRIGPWTVIQDAYNANPSSLLPALQNVADVAPGTWGVVLGDMLELGDESAKHHRAVGQLLNKLQPSVAVFIGPEMQPAYNAYTGAHGHWFPDAAHALPTLAELVAATETLLFKGSRGVKLETLIPALQAAAPPVG